MKKEVFIRKYGIEIGELKYKEYQQKQSENAKNRNFGGKITNRRVLEDEELQELIRRIPQSWNDKITLIKQRPFDTEQKWKVDISYNVCKEQTRILFFHWKKYLQPEIKCFNCNNELTLKDFKGTEFNKYCIDCTNRQVWKTGKFPKRGQKISSGKKRFFQTDHGKEVAKRVGIINSKKMKEYLQTDRGKEQLRKCAENNSKLMKEKIKNGTFVPCITNSWTHWNATIILPTGDVKKFRSSWEACFWNCNRHLLYEKIRISYVSNGESRTYIGDFYDDVQHILYEVKPKSSWNTQNMKMQQIIKYCFSNDIKFIWINEDNILGYIEESSFDDNNLPQLKQLYRGIGKEKN